MKGPRNRLKQHLADLAPSAPPQVPGGVKSQPYAVGPESKTLEDDVSPSRNIFTGVSIALACSFLLALVVSSLTMCGFRLLEGREYAPDWLIWFSAILSVFVSALVIERSISVPRPGERLSASKVGYWLIAFLLCIPFTALLAYLQLIIVWTVVDCFKLFTHEMPLADRWLVALCTVGPATLGAIIVGLCAAGFAKLTARSKFIELSLDGITLGPFCNPLRSLDRSTCNFIRWDWIERIDAVMDSGRKQLQIETVTGSVFRIAWQDLLYCYEPSVLLHMVQAKAPDALKESSLGQKRKNDAESYTDLWLRYFSNSSQRVRREHLRQGDKLCGGAYEIVGLLGTGGQASAYLASALKSDDLERTEKSAPEMPTDVVLKEYILPMHRGARTMASPAGILRREASLLQSLQHHGIVKLFDSFVEDGRGYLVLEYVEGITLKDLIASKGPLNSLEVVGLAMQVCDVLQYLHGLVPPIVHRDLTPDNLMMSSDRELKLLDFNVAWQMNPSTVTSLAGKQRYVPIEQIRGKPDTRSDIYALGSTMFYLLTALEPEPICQSVPCQYNDSVTPALNKVVATATNLNAKDRFQSAAEMLRALELCLTQVK
ncbi:MAG: serine/threonine protein kinase [Candidatus Obscuribacterales bacterium]|nr:serine/threonine protein kinase [Candidatus Obscuribacterales bacterium]